MTKQRANLGFGEALGTLDNFTPKPAPKPASDRQAHTKAAEELGFRSREPSVSSPPAAKQRRRRTGRNAQLNIKAKPETIEAFYQIADANGWGLGETLEYAVEALQK